MFISMSTAALATLAIILFSVICHEVAHGLVALALGDPTAYRRGRLTLNPVPHIDPIGTILIPAVLVYSASPILFGWAKPVPINPAYFRQPRTGMMWVAAAGPATNLLLAAILAGLYHLLGSTSPDWLMYAIAMGFLLNIVLMTFNLLPLPPLDGSRIVARFLPAPLLRYYAQLEPFGMFIIVGLLYSGVLHNILVPVRVAAIRFFGLDG
jgi:Zn-dependent protease